MSRLLGLASALAALAVPVSAPAAGLPVVPFPGTPDASPATQVIFSTLRPSQLAAVEVTGSRSGPHAGRLSRLPDGAGTAFMPNRPLRPGERVRVTARLLTAMAGARAGDPGARTLRFSFIVGRALHMPRPTGQRAGTTGAAADRGHSTLSFHSEPGLHPPAFTTTSDPDRRSGYILLSPTGGSSSGPMILDGQGKLIWYGQLKSEQALNLQVQRYRGQPVLTWFHGGIFGGTDVIMNASYRRIAVVRAGNGYLADLHEFRITRQGTALLDAYVPVHADLRSIGGPAHGTVFDDVIQEVDIPTGRILWEWHSLGHVPLSATYDRTPNSLGIYDYFHLNSIQQLPGGDLLISARNTWAVYLIDHRTGRVVWTLGGKLSSFTAGRGARFEWQHDAQLRAGGVLSLFDDADTPQEERESSAKVLHIDASTMRTTLIHRYTHTPPILAEYGGSAQLLPNHDVFVGWGSSPQFSEYTAQGRQIFTGSFQFGVGSYRAFRFRWRGQPARPPALAVSPVRGGGATIYASWNGATQVTAWRVLGGTHPNALRPVLRAARTGFETAISVSRALPYYAVQALNARRAVLATSATRAR